MPPRIIFLLGGGGQTDLIDSQEVLQINRTNLSSLGKLILDEWSDAIGDLFLTDSQHPKC